jgi:hypothetical protein
MVRRREGSIIFIVGTSFGACFFILVMSGGGIVEFRKVLMGKLECGGTVPWVMSGSLGELVFGLLLPVEQTSIGDFLHEQ